MEEGREGKLRRRVRRKEEIVCLKESDEWFGWEEEEEERKSERAREKVRERKEERDDKEK